MGARVEGEADGGRREGAGSRRAPKSRLAESACVIVSGSSFLHITLERISTSKLLSTGTSSATDSQPSIMPVFDCNFFPHLWDEVLSNLSYSDKLKLRFVSRALRDTVDKSLGGNEIRLWSWDKFYSVTDNRPHVYSVMPFFSPSSSECNEAQVLALHRARDIKICEPNLPRVFRLLQKHLPPNASVTSNHGVSLPPANNGGTFNTTFEIPACRSLCVCIKSPCGCKKQSPVRRARGTSKTSTSSFRTPSSSVALARAA